MFGDPQGALLICSAVFNAALGVLWEPVLLSWTGSAVILVKVTTGLVKGKQEREACQSPEAGPGTGSKRTSFLLSHEACGHGVTL